MTSTANASVGPEIARVPARDLVFVVGSGVSYAPPSGLPTGAHLRAQLLGDLMRCAATVLSPTECSRLKSAVAVDSTSIPDGAGGQATVFGIPFEGLLDIHSQLFPASDRITRFLTDNLVGASPNPTNFWLRAL